jgi:hypothetical protein
LQQPSICSDAGNACRSCHCSSSREGPQGMGGM